MSACCRVDTGWQSHSGITRQRATTTHRHKEKSHRHNAELTRPTAKSTDCVRETVYRNLQHRQTAFITHVRKAGTPEGWGLGGVTK